MRICIISNCRAGSSATADEFFEAAACHPDVVLKYTEGEDDAKRFAAEAVREGFDVVAAAGGDGTIHTVVNGLEKDFGRVCLGVIPLGTGNDFPRTLAIPEDPCQALALLGSGIERPIDLMRVEAGGHVVYGVNMAAGGFAGQMQEALPDLKRQFGPLAYLLGAVTTLPEMTEYATRIRFDDAPPEEITAVNIVVANGRTAGGGHVLAPQANPEDGLLDVVIVRAGPLLDLASLSVQYLAGNYLDHEQVLFRRARRIEIQSEPPMQFEVDGELLPEGAITFQVVPRALRAIVGPGYSADVTANATP